MTTPRSHYRQLADTLRQAIEAGVYPAGSLLPAMAELAREHDVSETTVNNAVAILRAEGLVRVERGTGTRVRQIAPIRRNAVARYQTEARERAGGHGAFDTEVRELGHEPRTETEVSEVPASAEVAQLLGVAEGAAVVARARLMFADDVPVQIATSYIPAEIARGTALAEVDSGPGGIISRFAELGQAQARISEIVQARSATDAERKALALDEAQPVLQITHTGWTADGRAVEAAIHVVPAGGWLLEYEWAVS